MAIQITIIGLGQIGASVGLALGDQKNIITRVGHDKEPEVSRRAKQIDAVDRTEYNLFSAVAGADLVLLTLPTDQIKETLKLIGPELREGAVVMDTALAKETVGEWASQYLPAERHYIGLIPIINSAYLHELDTGIEAAHVDLFQKGLMAIVSQPDTNPEAIKLAADLTRLIGSTPLFADAAEMDGIIASTHLLPQILAAALLNVTVDQPGWYEGRKLAGRAYAEATSAMLQPTSPESLASSAIYNPENTIRVINGLIAVLHNMRDDLQNQDIQSLTERLERAQTGREIWWNQRQADDWVNEEFPGTGELPKAGDVFGNLLGIRRKTKK
jgi:prephenate dehydrogenase